MKTKTSHSLPPEEKRVLQAIKRVRYQVFYLSRVDEAIIRDILLQGNGSMVGLLTMRKRSSSIMVYLYVFNFIFEF